MPIMTGRVSATIKTALTLWGIACALLGAARGFGIDDDAPHSNLALVFVYLSYYSVLIIGTFGFISSRIVSALLGLSALAAVTILVLTQPTNDGLGLGLSFLAALGVILRGPVSAINERVSQRNLGLR